MRAAVFFILLCLCLNMTVLAEGKQGWINENGNTYYYENASMATGWKTIEGKKYFFWGDGIMARSGTVEIEGITCTFSADGALIEQNGQPVLGDGWRTVNNQKYYYENAVMVTGWKTIDGQKYFFWGDGIMARGGSISMNGVTYWFNQDGTLASQSGNEQGDVSNGWKTIGGNKYYYENNVMAVGWRTIGDSRYFFWGDGIMARSGTITMEGVTYTFNADGVLVSQSGGQTGGQNNGWITNNGNQYYYENNVMVTGWKVIDGKKYFFWGDGVMARSGSIAMDGVKYTFADNGVLSGEQSLIPSGWTEANGNKYYYSGGVPVVGWRSIEGKQYFFWGDGVMARSGTITMAGIKYTFGADGVLVSQESAIPSGWVTDNGNKFYYENGVKATGWKTINGQKYFFWGDGVMARSGSIKLSGILYTFNESGVLISQEDVGIGEFVESGGNIYYYENGVAATGWRTIRGSRYFFWGDGVMARNGSITMDGKTYRFAPDGKLIESVQGIDVSAHQGIINWAAVKQNGVSFAIIRALSWNRTTNTYMIDPYFNQNVRNAKANGIAVGAYLYSYAFKESEMDEEIDFFLNSPEVKNLKNEGILFDFPVFIDYEDPLILKNTTSNDQRTNIVRHGMQRLKAAGYYPAFYTYEYFATKYLNAQQLMNEGYDFWIAKYGPSHSFNGVSMWQYASNGTVGGITGRVDMNVCYKDYPSIINPTGGNKPGVIEAKVSVFNINSGSVVTDTLPNILAGIVQNEVGGFGNAEVNKAQAVAAHSWLLNQLNNNVTTPAVGLANPSESVRSAVQQVKDYVVMYAGAPAMTCYGSSNSTVTNSSANMWGTDLPYLPAGISSPGDKDAVADGKPAYGRTTTVGLQRMRQNIEKIYPGATNGRSDYENWITSPQMDSNGYLKSIMVMGNATSAAKFFENCYGLYSPNFKMTYNGNGTWTFVTYGNGHCVGMSQYGAYGFAKQGWGWEAILNYYFPNTNIITA